MKVIVSENTPSQRTLEVTLDETRVEGAYQKAFGKVARGLALPGFRKGKVPLHLAKKYITDDGLTKEVIEDLVPTAYRAALVQENLIPISEPKWEVVQRERGKDLIFKVSFEIKPILPITDYRGVELQHERESVTDAAVDTTLEEMRNHHASLVDAEEGRVIQQDDVARVDYTSYHEGQPVEGGSAEGYMMEVKPENFIPGFTDHLLGLTAGQDKEFDVTFPADYPNPALAGKHIHFQFHVHEVKVRHVPALDDEFAKVVSGLESVQALRDEVRKRLEVNLERRVREQVAVKIIDRLLPQVTPEHVPSTLHHWRTRLEIHKRLQELNRMGVALERYLADRKITQDQWTMELSVLGQLECRVEILVESLAYHEGIKVTDQEVDQLLQAEARRRGVPLTQLKQQVDEESSLSLIRYSMLRAKVMDFLFEEARVQYVEPGSEPVREPAPKAPKKAKAAEKKAEAASPAEEKAGEPPAKPKAAEKKAEAASPAEEKAKEPAGEAPAKPKRAAKKKADG